MNPFAVVATKVIGGGTAAALLSLGVAGGLAQAASPRPSSHDHRADHRAIAAAVLTSEADVLGLSAEQLRADLKAGQKVSDLARDRGMDKAQFAAKLVADLKPRLETLVEHKQITQAQAERAVDRISKGHVPYWDGAHRRR